MWSRSFWKARKRACSHCATGIPPCCFGTAQDHKRVGEGDTGPNTGGMGAYSPAPILDQETISEVMGEIIVPTLAAMHHKGMPFHGVLYAGLMLTADGPKLIEYNVRFGDPECQVLMPRLKSDLVELLVAAIEGDLLIARAAMVTAGGAYGGDGGEGLSRRTGKRHGRSTASPRRRRRARWSSTPEPR